MCRNACDKCIVVWSEDNFRTPSIVDDDDDNDSHLETTSFQF